MIADLQQNAPNQAPEPPKKLRNGQFTLSDIEFVASAVAEGNTESEAVLLLNKEPKQWFRFKNRVKVGPKYGKILERMRGAYIRGNIAQIKKAATGSDGVRHDWRAADRLNAIIAPERFAQNREQTVHNHQTAIIASVGSEEQLAKLVAMYAGQAKEQQKVVEIESVKQIGEKSQNDAQ